MARVEAHDRWFPSPPSLKCSLTHTFKSGRKIGAGWLRPVQQIQGPTTGLFRHRPCQRGTLNITFSGHRHPVPRPRLTPRRPPARPSSSRPLRRLFNIGLCDLEAATTRQRTRTHIRTRRPEVESLRQDGCRPPEQWPAPAHLRRWILRGPCQGDGRLPQG